ncbi:M14 family zinc carboxypeptidase [Nocardioides ferulae]|uniref:M14 family zinc carboxypeptidase n=1 Tax=Nocardioides ferulae TaxID=2340821 RepID=UPI00197F2DAF|nr:M14 family zinc carboxypeptidase [Nocardioides ferulae]
MAGALLVAALGAGQLSAPGTSAAGPVGEVFRPQLVTVATPTAADKQRLTRLGLDLTEHAGHDYVEVVLHTPLDLARLAAAGFDHDVRIPDLIARSLEVAAANERYAARVARSPLPSGRVGYRTLADYESDMAELAERHRRIVRTFTLPRPSLDGRAIHAVEIGRGVRRGLTGQPTFVLLGVHHAREWPSGELAMEFAIDLADNYGRDPRITRLLRRARVVVVPVVNVDGFHLSRTDGEFLDLRALNDYDPLDGSLSVLATVGQAYKRKNCRIVDGQDTSDGSCVLTLNSNGGFGSGVDLNRNYGGFWGGPGAAGPTPDAGEVGAGILDPTYRGAAPFSEPETQNVRDLIASRQVTMMISNHTFSNLILRPNGVNPATLGPDGKPVGDAPDESALKRLGAKMAAQNGYANIHGWQLYDTTGTTEDWSYNATGGFGYTFEIGANEFHPPFPEVVDEYLGAGEHAGKGNREAYLIALEHAVDTAYSGVISGRAPRGATLRLTKSFETPTWAGSFADGVDTAIEPRGRFSWVVNPSTRPVVQPRSYTELATEPYDTRTTEGAVAGPGEHTDHEVVLDEAVDVWRIDLDWPTPDDLDLTVFRKEGDELVEVGSSGNAPGEKESVEVPSAAAGRYVVRVTNYASLSPSYTLTESLFRARTHTTAGHRESYTFTCEVEGRVLQRERVFIDRGERLRLDLAPCRRRA